MNAALLLDDLPDEKCAWCGKPFETARWWQKYCSAECRYASRAAFLKQEVRSKLARLRCQHCGEPITNAKKTDTKYCCIPCRTAAARDRRFGRLADLRCVDCGGPIPGALRRNTRFCLSCTRNRQRAANRERRRRKSAQR